MKPLQSKPHNPIIVGLICYGPWALVAIGLLLLLGVG